MKSWHSQENRGNYKSLRGVKWDRLRKINSVLFFLHAKPPFLGAREMAQRMRACIILPEDLNSIPSTHGGELTACNSSSKKSNTLLWPLQALHSCAHRPAHRKQQVELNQAPHKSTSPLCCSCDRFVFSTSWVDYLRPWESHTSSGIKSHHPVEERFKLQGE